MGVDYELAIARLCEAGPRKMQCDQVGLPAVIAVGVKDVVVEQDFRRQPPDAAHPVRQREQYEEKLVEGDEADIRRHVVTHVARVLHQLKAAGQPDELHQLERQALVGAKEEDPREEEEDNTGDVDGANDKEPALAHGLAPSRLLVAHGGNAQLRPNVHDHLAELKHVHQDVKGDANARAQEHIGHDGANRDGKNLISHGRDGHDRVRDLPPAHAQLLALHMGLKLGGVLVSVDIRVGNDGWPLHVASSTADASFLVAGVPKDGTQAILGRGSASTEDSREKAVKCAQGRARGTAYRAS
mmetsp:Transcript_9761/g.28649  ORF Transcript_9761/g.28649 Transcript_9761/m.28649 type:complete len:299 (+) Transcript_9761:1397-2293(+)